MNRATHVPFAVLMAGLMLAGCHQAERQPEVRVALVNPNRDSDAALLAYLGLNHLHGDVRSDGTVAISNDERHRAVLYRYESDLYLRMRVCRENLLNAEVTQDARGVNNPYRRRLVVSVEGSNAEVQSDPSPCPRRYEPGHPLADNNGYYLTSNVDPLWEKLTLEATEAELETLRRVLRELATPGCNCSNRAGWTGSLREVPHPASSPDYRGGGSALVVRRTRL